LICSALRRLPLREPWLDPPRNGYFRCAAAGAGNRHRRRHRARPAAGGCPPFIFKDETYLYLSIAVSLLVFIFHQQLDMLLHPLTYFDAVGLGTFVVIGTGKAIDFKLGFIGAVMMGVITATAGGMIRDLLSARVPMVLQKEVYASACLAGGH